MKFVHISDLHLGKRVNDFSMTEDQRWILNQMKDKICDSFADAVIIAGDIYDKSVPSAEAVVMFDEFLTELSEKNIKVFVISGNHDSAERMGFGADLFEKSGVYVSQAFSGTVKRVDLEDEYGELSVYLLPFIKPVHVRAYLRSESKGDADIQDIQGTQDMRDISTYDEAVRAVLAGLPVDRSRRNILVAHQFVTGAITSDSEELYVGGLDNVGVDAFAGFDYTALGHIHRPQKIVKETVRYSGTPLKYSFSEVSHKKSMTVVELREKGVVDITEEMLIPLRDMQEIRGTYMEVTSSEFYRNLNRDDYFHITLTDEDDIPEVIAKLRIIYPNVMRLDYDNKRTAQGGRNVENSDAGRVAKKEPAELFGELFEMQNNAEMDEKKRQFLNRLIEQIWEA